MKMLKKHLFLLFLNAIICISQILITIIYWNNMNSLMIFGCIGIAFGTALNSIVYVLQLIDSIQQKQE